MSDGKFVRFPDDLLHRIEEIAERESRTFANTVRLLCVKGLGVYDAATKAAEKAA